MNEPAFVRNGLDPASLRAGRRLGSEVKIDGTAFEILQFEHGPERRLVLASPNLAARISVIDRYRPEQLTRHGQRHSEFVVRASVHISTASVAQAQPVKRSGPRISAEHGG